MASIDSGPTNIDGVGGDTRPTRVEKSRTTPDSRNADQAPTIDSSQQGTNEAIDRLQSKLNEAANKPEGTINQGKQDPVAAQRTQVRLNDPHSRYGRDFMAAQTQHNKKIHRLFIVSLASIVGLGVWAHLIVNGISALTIGPIGMAALLGAWLVVSLAAAAGSEMSANKKLKNMQKRLNEELESARRKRQGGN